MWVITAYSNSNIIMYEFDTEEEARKKFRQIEEYKILSEIVYCSSPKRAVIPH